MPNMSYCKFENTYGDLADCYDDIWNKDLSDTEKKYRKLLIQMCREISDEFPEELDTDEEI
jgi:hypothetical protein